MPIDASELGLEAVFYAVVGTVGGVLVSSIVLALVVSRWHRRELRPMHLLQSLVVVVAVVVVTVVVWRTIEGDVTGWDLVWAFGLAAAAWWSGARLIGTRDSVRGRPGA